WADDWTEFDPVNAEYDLIITTTAVAEAGPVLNLNVYPNPVSASLTVEFDLADNQEVTIEVTDVTGKVVSSILPATSLNAGVQRLSANLGNLSEGVYFVAIKTDNGVKTVKTLVSK
ncbi:MAG TPA: T9SS type A sorting domain-containing protein, partial [Bacteroidia bacterium]|nr:T9SS type A sorting domain-containing protein [Bacteroidia bacterium]